VFAYLYFTLQESFISQHQQVEEWMLVCQHNVDFHSTADCDNNYNWSASSAAYANLDEFPSFISRYRQSTPVCPFTTTADPVSLQVKQFMEGRKLLGQVDRRLRQSFLQHFPQTLGGCSCLIFGDFG